MLEPIEPIKPIEREPETIEPHTERPVETYHPAPEKAPDEVERISAETAKERAEELARSVATDDAQTPAPATLLVSELLKSPERLRALSSDDQLKVILDLVIAKDFPVAHNFVETLGKKEDLAFYAWLEDALHDTALRDDWREYLESKK